MPGIEASLPPRANRSLQDRQVSKSYKRLAYRLLYLASYQDAFPPPSSLSLPQPVWKPSSERHLIIPLSELLYCLPDLHSPHLRLCLKLSSTEARAPARWSKRLQSIISLLFPPPPRSYFPQQWPPPVVASAVSAATPLRSLSREYLPLLRAHHHHHLLHLLRAT